MSKDIGAFLEWLQDAFQSFYNWLVGASLWMDMWNQLLSIASQMIGILLGDLGSKFFEPIKAAFTSALQAIENTWNTGWQMVQTTFTTTTSQISTGLTTTFDAMKGFVQANLGEYAPIATQALTAMQGSVNIGMALIQGDWQGAFLRIQDVLSQWGSVATAIMSGIMGTLQGVVSGGVNAMIGSFNSLIASIQSAFSQAQALFQQAQQVVAVTSQQVVQTVAATGTNMVQDVVGATQTITDEFGQVFQGIYDGAQWLWTMLVGGSVWPVMMNTMERITDETMTRIQNTVALGFASVVSQAQRNLVRLESLRQQAAMAAQSIASGAGVPANFNQIAAAMNQAYAAQQATARYITAGGQTYDINVIGETLANRGWWAPASSMNLSGQQFTDYAQAVADAAHRAQILSGALTPSKEQLAAYPEYYRSLGININVQVDGQTVAKTVENRLINQRQIAGL
jgi:hypothetical protein